MGSAIQPSKPRGDVVVAVKIWGPNIPALKGKTVGCKPQVVTQDVLAVTKEI